VSTLLGINSFAAANAVYSRVKFAAEVTALFLMETVLRLNYACEA